MKINIFQDLTLKLIALALAVIIWVLVVGEQKSEVQLTVPLELRDLPENLEFIERTSQVDVTLRGFSSSLKRLTPNDIDVHIDLSNVVRGTNSFVIAPDDIIVPVGVRVFQVSPSNLDVLLDATVRKSVPVKPNMRGAPISGFIFGEVTVEPKNVTIAGAQSLVKPLSKVETETIVLENVSKDLVKKVKVRLPNNTLRIEKDEEKVVSVAIKIVHEMTDRFFENIPLLVKDETRSYKLSADSITALVHGPKIQLLQMKPEGIAAYIDISSLPEGRSVVKPTFELLESVVVKTYYPKTITITIAESN